VLQRTALLVVAATLLVVMTASFAWAQENTNPCPPGQFEDPANPGTIPPTCLAAKDVKGKARLPKSGGEPLGSLLLPAAILLVGGGVLGYAVLRRR
jgi:nitrogen fixation-related uncharacterized protein